MKAVGGGWMSLGDYELGLCGQRVGHSLGDGGRAPFIHLLPQPMWV